MKTSLQKLCSQIIDALGVAMFAGVALGLAMPGLMPKQVNAIITPPTTSAMASIDYVNCLWYVARNEGFYSLQHAVATGSSTAANRLLWIRLVESVEPAVCGFLQIDMDDLTRALSDTVSDADRHFMAMRQSG